MECLVVVERKSNSRHDGGGVAQFDRAQNSNSKVALVRCLLSLLSTWGKKTLSNQLPAVQLSGYEHKLATART